jgi:hypothetical protein
MGNLIWVFILTIGLQGTDTTLELEYRAKSLEDCNKGREMIIEEVRKVEQDYDYWYVSGCEKDPRHILVTIDE